VFSLSLSLYIYIYIYITDNNFDNLDNFKLSDAAECAGMRFVTLRFRFVEFPAKLFEFLLNALLSSLWCNNSCNKIICPRACARVRVPYDFCCSFTGNVDFPFRFIYIHKCNA